jgi:hypothetical protein
LPTLVRRDVHDIVGLFVIVVIRVTIYVRSDEHVAHNVVERDARTVHYDRSTRVLTHSVA